MHIDEGLYLENSMVGQECVIIHPMVGGEMTKIHHKAQPPHEVCTPIPLLVPDDFTIPFNLQKAPLKLPWKV